VLAPTDARKPGSRRHLFGQVVYFVLTVVEPLRERDAVANALHMLLWPRIVLYLTLLLPMERSEALLVPSKPNSGRAR
jgi:hypothetical protein